MNKTISKTKANKFLFLFLFFLTTTNLITNAQTIPIGSNETLSISNPQFLPFESFSNEDAIETFTALFSMGETPLVNITVTNVSGSAFTIAPAREFMEIGSQRTIQGDGSFELDFSADGQNGFMGDYGISIVPQGLSSTFMILVTLPEVSTSSSSSSSGGGTNLIPNGLGVFTGTIDSGSTFDIFFPPDFNNPQCGSSPFGISINDLNGNDTLSGITNSIFSGNLPNRSFTVSSEMSFLFLPESDTGNKSKGTISQSLVNDSDMTKLFLTGIFPVSADSGELVSIGRTFEPLFQNNVALAAVQHTIISATMPWQLSNNGGFFITQGGGCLSPFCVIVEQGMIVIDPDGACTPDKLNKRKSKYATTNPSMLFDPFPHSANTIQVPVTSIVKSMGQTSQNNASVNTDTGILIFQPLPPSTNIKQELKLTITGMNG